ncbi:hypothetical protein J6590_036426 [Homalodisca vitripennis]|nr:hypothetical protein J6590_036426 [Homalodisca vitripennis]
MLRAQAYDVILKLKYPPNCKHIIPVFYQHMKWGHSDQAQNGRGRILELRVAIGEPPFLIHSSTTKAQCTPDQVMAGIDNGMYTAVE